MLNKNIILSTLLTLLLLPIPALSKADSQPQIAITQLVQHEAADMVREGIMKALKDNGYEDGKTATILYENAQGNPTIAAQIARKFAGMELDIILPITTPSAQTVLKAQSGKKVPIIFSAVTDPVKAGLVKAMDKPGGVITGVTDMPPIKDQIAFIKTLLPEAKKLGVLYNPGDEGSTLSLQIIKDTCKEEGLILIESPATRSVDVKGAVLFLVGKVDAVYVPLDNTFVSAMRTVSQLAAQHNMPLFTADSGSVVDGALACLGFSYYDQGIMVGEIAVSVLKGEDPANISVGQPTSKTVYINTRTADQLGLLIPKEIASKAKLL